MQQIEVRLVAVQKSLVQTGLAFAFGSTLATSWYAITSSILSGPLAQVTATCGAVAICGLAPVLLVKSNIRRETRKSTSSMSQRLKAFNMHAIVNIVDEFDLLTEVNDQLIEITGYKREDLIGKPVSILYDESSLGIAREIRGDLVRGETWQGETPLRRADGTIFHTQTTIMPLFDDRGEWAGSISVRTDVTRSKQLLAERATAETLHHLRDDIWIVDAMTERFTYMNRAALYRLDWPVDGHSERSMADLPDLAGRGAILDACKALDASGDIRANIEIHFMEVPFEVSIKSLQMDGQPGRFLIALRDISERQRQERETTDFVSTVSHELRSPLTSIKGSMGLLLSNAAGDLPDKARNLLEIAHRNADRLVLIINDILDHEKISSGQMDFNLQETDIAALVCETNEANSMLRQRFGLQVKTVGTSEPLFVHTDENRIIQVLTNLLSNACKFSRPGGSVTLSVSDEGDAVRVSVHNEGHPIEKKDQHKIFERFADLQNSDRAAKGGTGLGLSISKAIVENLGGSIGFDSREGAGTTFYFVLPRKNADISDQDIFSDQCYAS